MRALRTVGVVGVLTFGRVASAGETDLPHWRITLASPVLHWGSMGCYCDLVGDIEEPAAWGGLIRLERVRTRRIGISGELAVNVVESEFELIDAPGENPVHTRAGAGLVVRLVTIPVLDLQVTPRAGLFYGNYEHYSMMGPWGGVGFDALGWLTESLAFSVGVDGRVTVVSYMGGSGYYEGIEDHSGLRAEYELIVGFVFLL